MLEAPKQNWELYDEQCRSEHVAWLRNLDPNQALGLYEDLYSLAANQPESPDLRRLEERRWTEKLDIQKRLTDAFIKVDRSRSERRHPKNAD